MTKPTATSMIEDLTPATGTTDIAPLLDQMELFISTHTVLPEGTSTVVTLWCLSTYLINQFRIYPRLIITSPEKRCGKSTLLDLVEAFSYKPLMTSNLTEAVIYRLIEACQPTLIIDEADTFVTNSTSGMTGIINSGHAKNRAFVFRCGENNFEPEKFSTWSPMVLAAIGILQPTIMDRGIEVRMLRKLGTDTVPRLPNNLVSTAKTGRAQFLKWAMDNASIIETNTIEPPNIGSDRAVDNWLPLFTIAKQISPEWYKKCEQAYLLLEANAKEPELPTLLLEDLRTIILNHGGNRISSAEVISQLVEDKDKPWCEASHGKSISPHKLAEMLRPYGIKPKSKRMGSKTTRGYDTADFTDTFERYL